MKSILQKIFGSPGFRSNGAASTVAARSASGSFRNRIQNSVDMFLSPSWPYESVTPLQAYIFGVSTAILVFAGYIYLFHETDEAYPEDEDDISSTTSYFDQAQTKAFRRRLRQFNRHKNQISTRYRQRIRQNQPTLYNRVYSERRNNLNERKMERTIQRRTILENAWTTDDMPSNEFRSRTTHSDYKRVSSSCTKPRPPPKRIFRQGRISQLRSSHLMSGCELQQISATSLCLSKRGNASPNAVSLMRQRYNTEQSAAYNVPTYSLLQHMNNHPLQCSSSTTDVRSRIERNALSQRNKCSFPTSNNLAIHPVNNVQKIRSRLGKENLENFESSSLKSKLSAKNSFPKKAQRNMHTENTPQTTYSNALTVRDDSSTLSNHPKPSESLTTTAKAETSAKCRNENLVGGSSVPVNARRETSSSGFSIKNSTDKNNCRKEGPIRSDGELSSPSNSYSRNERADELRGEIFLKTSHGIKRGFLVVLMSIGVYDRIQEEHQTLALQMLKEGNIPHKIVNGMDFMQKERRNELFAVSGIRGNYPQFFFEPRDGNISFLGQWKKLENLLLAGHVFSTPRLVPPHKFSKKLSVQSIPTGTSSLSLNEEDSHIPAKFQKAEAQLIVLLSVGVADRVQDANQKAAIQMLNDQDVPHEIIDGMNPLQRKRRDNLFEISGIRGNYPQFFLCDGSGIATFMGQWEDFEMMLMSGLIHSKLHTKKQQQLLLHPSNNQNNNFNEISILLRYGAKLTVLISNGVFDRNQRENQTSSLRLLNERNVPYNLVDGMDPLQRKNRDQFFDISGIRGNYPQFFLSSDSATSYLGGYDWLKTKL